MLSYIYINGKFIVLLGYKDDIRSVIFIGGMKV